MYMYSEGSRRFKIELESTKSHSSIHVGGKSFGLMIKHILMVVKHSLSTLHYIYS